MPSDVARACEQPDLYLANRWGEKAQDLIRWAWTAARFTRDDTFGHIDADDIDPAWRDLSKALERLEGRIPLYYERPLRELSKGLAARPQKAGRRTEDRAIFARAMLRVAARSVPLEPCDLLALARCTGIEPMLDKRGEPATPSEIGREWRRLHAANLPKKPAAQR
jgi:hypothetical protein